MPLVLSSLEVRVLGALVEKELSTPEYYPLTLNALVNACNQKSNRDPVMQLEEGDVQEALDSLQHARLAGVVSGAGSRAVKFRHSLREALDLGPDELAVVAELLLRGPQTAGELRARASRMTPFSSLEAAQETLRRLSDRAEPFVVELPRRPGRKETRFAHLLSGEPVEEDEPAAIPAMTSRAAEIEAEVADLRERVERLEQAFAAFRSQFE